LREGYGKLHFGVGCGFLADQAAKRAIFSYLEGFYKGTRIDASPGYRSPAGFEKATMEKGKAA
jgi:hypothetical protein